MATNKIINSYGYTGEVDIFHDLVTEMIESFGVDVVYISRAVGEVDDIFNEARLSIFDVAADIDMYVKTADSFGGEGDFLSKFGLQINDQITFTVGVRKFAKYVTAISPRTNRPLEGDVIWFPFSNKMYKIMHVEHESVFYQSGTLASYDLKCELLEYSGERFQTGRPNIDTYFKNVDMTRADDMDDMLDLDPTAKNIFFEEEGEEILDFSEKSPFDEIITFPKKD
jgi:hypothetical protein